MYTGYRATRYRTEATALAIDTLTRRWRLWNTRKSRQQLTAFKSSTMAYYGSRQVCQLPERMIIIVLLLLPARHRSPRIVLSNIEMVQMRTYIHMWYNQGFHKLYIPSGALRMLLWWNRLDVILRPSSKFWPCIIKLFQSIFKDFLLLVLIQKGIALFELVILVQHPLKQLRRALGQTW